MYKKKFYIDQHVFIPKHAKLSDKEKSELLEKYSITLKELPKIHKNDPAIRALNAKTGDIIKITRKEQTGESVYYRGVINV